MNNIIKQLVLHSLQRLYFSVVPTVACLKDRYQSFSFFRFSTSKTYCLCLPVVLSVKEENYINFRVLHTKVKLFNSFTCKTTYSLLLKELIELYYNSFRFVREKPLIILGELFYVFTTFRQV